MFELKTIRLTKNGSTKKQLILLFDLDSYCPCLYPMLFSMKVLRFQSLSTQSADLIALKLWYSFWFDKYSTSFCESFFSSAYNFEIIQNEIDNFIIYLENNNQFNNVLRLRSNKDINYDTLAIRISSLLKFYKFLIDEYLTLHSQPNLTRNEINRIKINLDNYIKHKKKIIKSFSRTNKTIKSEINYAFKSLTAEMLKALYQVIAPSKSTLVNSLNPFKLHEAQIRNFLIVHLMLNYGLRVGELMLLTVNSIKKSIQGNFYSLIVANTEDEFDNRQRKPNIKNVHSYRVLELQERDYQFLNIYISQIRKKNPSEILFTSLKPPYSALSYSSISKFFDKINEVLRSTVPEYFDDRAYDSIEKLTPHVCRHTWAYMMLSYSFKKYENEDKLRYPAHDVIHGALDKAKEDLRSMGGWSPTSEMPSYYGKRFIVERANHSNLSRIINMSINFE